MKEYLISIEELNKKPKQSYLDFMGLKKIEILDEKEKLREKVRIARLEIKQAIKEGKMV